MTEDEFREFVASSPWKFAQTMANIPHEYSLRKKHEDDQRFADAVQFIRESGYVQSFYGREYRYFDLGGHQYWTMGAPVEETILINRAVRVVGGGNAIGEDV